MSTDTDTDGTHTDRDDGTDDDRTDRDDRDDGTDGRTSTLSPEYRRDERTSHDDVDPPVSFYDDLVLSEASKRDWRYFQRWHYLGHTIGVVIDAYVLWRIDDDDAGRQTPVGFVAFGPASLASTNRRKTFGDRHFPPRVVNKWFGTVSRVVLDPRYRGAGVASDMLRAACMLYAERNGVKYIEAKTSMGAVNHFNQAAGFTLMGTADQLNPENTNPGGGNIGFDDSEKDPRKIRRVYEFIMDSETELDVDLDYP